MHFTKTAAFPRECLLLLDSQNVSRTLTALLCTNVK